MRMEQMDGIIGLLSIGASADHPISMQVMLSSAREVCSKFCFASDIIDHICGVFLCEEKPIPLTNRAEILSKILDSPPYIADIKQDWITPKSKASDGFPTSLQKIFGSNLEDVCWGKKENGLRYAHPKHANPKSEMLMDQDLGAQMPSSSKPEGLELICLDEGYSINNLAAPKDMMCLILDGKASDSDKMHDRTSLLLFDKFYFGGLLTARTPKTIMLVAW